MIDLKHISVTFNAGTPLANPIFKDFSLKLETGEFVTLIGGNGAGKSTLMNVLSGDINVQRGRVLIDGLDVTRQSTEQRARYVSRVFQDPMLGTCADLTVEENLSLACRRGRSRGLARALYPKLRTEFQARLAELGIGLENRLQDPMGLLSGGQRQAISLLMATLEPSKVLLLDEHTAALDPKMAQLIIELTRKLVAEKQLTTFMITHSMSYALELGTRTILMHHGEILQDLHGELRAKLKPADLVAFFGEVSGEV